MKKGKKIGVIFIILLALVVGFYMCYVAWGGDKMSFRDIDPFALDVRVDVGVRQIFRDRYGYRIGDSIVDEMFATVGNLSEQMIVSEVIQKYEGNEMGPDEREELETLLAQTDSDGVKEVVRFILQRNDIRVSSSSGDAQGIPTVTIEPLITPIYSHFDKYIKVTRIGGAVSEPLFVNLKMSGMRSASTQIHIPAVHIPAGESEYVHRESTYGVEGSVVTYTITGCGRRSPACDYANYSYEQCTPKTVPCHIGNPSTAILHFAARKEEPTVLIKPVATPVSGLDPVAFLITRTGDISKYLGILLDCRTPNSYPGPMVDRTLIPAGTRTMVHSYPSISATSMTCSVGTGEHWSDQATVEIIHEGE